jgi:hypothetical protein
VKSPTAPRQRDRRLVFALFLAATFGMMIVLSLPLARFIPLAPRIPGLLGFPSFLDPLRPLLPPPGEARPPETVARADAGAPRDVAPVLPSRVVGSGPGAVPGTISPTDGGPRVLGCRAGDTSERGQAGKRRPRKGPSGKKRVGVGPARRCQLTSLRDGPRGTEGPAWTIPRHRLNDGPALTKHGQKHPGKGHHRPVKTHRPKKR